MAASPLRKTPTANAPQRPCIQVVDDDAGIQNVFRILGEQMGYDVVAYRSVAEFEARVGPDRHGCFVFDLMLPDGTGLDLLRHLVSLGNDMPVVFMSGMGGIAEAVQAVKLGSIDYLEKPFEVAQMKQLLARAVELDLERRRRAEEVATLECRFAQLSPREREVMELVVQGAANKEVAARLQLSPKTVEVHRANVMRKTGAETLAELVRMHVALSEAHASTPVA